MSDFSQMTENISARVQAFLRDREREEDVKRVVDGYRATGRIWSPDELTAVDDAELGAGDA